ncbi:Uncharacterised protein [Campylobacter jejuni]|nr:Uncharacterised protein [Campylobacter jejuni]
MTVIDQFAAHVGLDWADKKHDFCVQFKNGERTFHVIKHTPEALGIWLNELHQKIIGRIAIARPGGVCSPEIPIYHCLSCTRVVTGPLSADLLAKWCEG